MLVSRHLAFERLATSLESAVGDFGWFYGDFFIPDSHFKPTLCYTGIYRFLNNPDCVTGFVNMLACNVRLIILCADTPATTAWH